MTRRGRPRKSGPREPNGQLQRKTRRDAGTPEIKSLRASYAGDGFKEAARAPEADESGKLFERAFKKLVPPKQRRVRNNDSN